MNPVRWALLLSISIVCASAAAAAQQKAAVRVSLLQLVTNPGAYDGKIVEVDGYLVLAGAETGGRLVGRREDSESKLPVNSVRVERTEQMESEKAQLDGNYVSIVGVFRRGDAQRKGTGLLHEITSCRLVPQPPGERASPQESTASEAAVVADLHALYTACVSYAVAYSIGYPVQLSVLGPSSRLDKDGAGLIDRTLASGRRHGYVFTYAPGRPAAGGIASYTIHADPSPPGRAGLRHFFTNESGVIRVNAWARASASDGVYKEAANSAPANPVKSGRIRVSSEVQALRLIIRAAPQYPELARQARIQGTVRMRAIVAKDGTVEQLDVISGPPMLVRAAIDAAKDWRYAPTVIGGNPVEVETIIEVNFSLKDLPPPGKAPN